jgi:large subunit ribosomal protein L25
MSAKVMFSAQPRTLMGKKAARLRRQHLVPANVSGSTDTPRAVSIGESDFRRLYDQVGDTGLVYLKVEDEKTERPVLVNEVQVHPVNDSVTHVVFRQVDLNQKVEAEVPVEFIGELAVRNALAVKVHDAVMVSALPQDLPEKFVIDISKFTEFGQMVTFSQLEFDHSKVELKIEAAEEETPVVLIQEVKEQPVEVAPAPAEGTTETPAEAPAAEPAEKKE